jgi:hypothetical protein
LKRGLLPALSQIPTVSSLEEMPLVVNLVGLNEAISNLIPERQTISKRELAYKILETASKVAEEKASKLGDRGLVSMIHQEGDERLSEIDSEKYGRAQESRRGGYQEGITIQSVDSDSSELMNEISEQVRATSGGCLVRLGFPKEAAENLNFGNVVSSLSGKLPFARISRTADICKKCGMKVFGGGRCSYCKSTSLIPSQILV